MASHHPVLFPPSPRRRSTTFELLLPTCCSISKPPARYMRARPVFLTPPNEPVLPSSCWKLWITRIAMALTVSARAHVHATVDIHAKLDFTIAFVGLLDVFGMDDTIEHCVSCLCLGIGPHGLMFVRMDNVLGWGVCGCYMQMKREWSPFWGRNSACFSRSADWTQ